MLVGVQMYEKPTAECTWCGLSPSSIKMADSIDMVILIIFIYECFVKQLAEGFAPWRYFINAEWKWNVFDFTIVVLCLPFWGDTFGGGSVALLRMMRLMRVMKLVKKIPQLQMIIMGLVGGMKSIAYIMLLLFLVFYLYAIAGIMAFRDNDPWHYGDLFTALLTLFRASTLEDWTDIMYINYYGCRSSFYDSGIYTTNLTEASSGFAFCPELGMTAEDCAEACGVEASTLQGHLTGNTFPAGGIFTGTHSSCQIPVNNLTTFIVEPCVVTVWENDAGNDQFYPAEYTVAEIKNGGWDPETTSGGKPLLTIIYFLTFIVISALVMLSLFIGAVTMSMADALEEMKTQSEEADRRRRMEKAKQKQQEQDRIKAEMKAKAEAKAEKARRKSLASGRGSPTPGSPESQPGNTSSATLLEAEVLNEEEVAMQSMLLRAWGDVDLLKLLESGKSDSQNPIAKLYIRLAWICDTIAEDSRFQNLITFVIICAGIMVGLQTYEHLNRDHGPFLDVLDLIILILFTIEVVLKMVAKEFKPWRYFYYHGVDGWNTFDFIVVAGSFLPGSGGMLTMLRLLRLLRVLKLLKAFPELQVIVVALIGGLGSIGYIGVILLMVFYIFAIGGMIVFMANDPWHFGTLHISMFTLFRASTCEDWTDIMYVNMHSCQNYGYSVGPGVEEIMCKDPSAMPAFAAVFFTIFTIIAAMVLLTLFIGVVTTSMEEATERQKEAKEVEAKVIELAKEKGLDDETLGLYKKVFALLDIDGGGTIDEDELRIGLKSIGRKPSEEHMKKMMSVVDEDDSGEIDMAEFVQFMLIMKEHDEKEKKAEEDKQLKGVKKGINRAHTFSGKVGGDPGRGPNALPPLPKGGEEDSTGAANAAEDPFKSAAKQYDDTKPDVENQGDAK